jgi:hypothetical protein
MSYVYHLMPVVVEYETAPTAAVSPAAACSSSANSGLAVCVEPIHLRVRWMQANFLRWVADAAV